MTQSTTGLVEPDPFAWIVGLKWHEPAHRAVLASVQMGGWLSAALDDPKVCDAMKADIREWFSAGEPMETLGQAATHFAEKVSTQETTIAELVAALEPFANAAADCVWDDELDSASIWEHPASLDVTIGHLRRAIEVLAKVRSV